MALFNVMKLAHKHASKIMNDCSKDMQARLGINTYKDAFRLALSAAHNLNKILTKCVKCGASVEKMMDGQIFNILGKDYECVIMPSSDIYRTLLGKTAPEGCEVAQAYMLSFAHDLPRTYDERAMSWLLDYMTDEFSFGARFYNPTTNEYFY